MPVYDDEKTDGSTGLNTNQTSKSLNEREAALDSQGAQPLSGDEQAKLDSISRNYDDNTIGSGFEDSEGPSRYRGAATKKRGIIGGIIALILGGSFGVFTIASGPLQFIHMAQLLQRFHFASMEDLGDERMSKISRYIRYKNRTERTRLGVVGNLYADSIEKRFNKSGIESAYTKYRNFDGYIIDPLKIPEDSALGDLQNKTPDEIRTYLVERYEISPERIKLDLDAGKVAIEGEGLGFFKSRRLMKSMMDDVGFSKITSTLRTRIMSKRNGVTLHPLRRLDQKLLSSTDARLAKWRADRQKRIDSGERTVSTNLPPQELDEEGNPKPQSPDVTDTDSKIKETVAEGDAAAKEIKEGIPTSSDGAFAKLRASTGAKLAGSVSTAIGVLCLVKGIADNIDNIKYLNIVLPLTRLGLETISIGNQVMTGQDINMEQLRFYSKQLNDPKTGSWAAAKSIQAELGQEQTGPDIGDEAKLGEGKNIVSQFINQLPFLNGVCKAAGSAVGQVVSFGIDLLGGPFSAVGGQIIGKYAFGPLLEKLTSWIAGHPININIAGADYGNYINYGARLAANDTAISGGGIALSKAQVAALDQHRFASEREETIAKGFTERFFNPYDSTSLIAQVIDRQNPNLSANLASTFNSFTNISKTLFTTLGSIFSPRLHAATDYDYGFPEYGFSVQDINSQTVNNPFENAEIVADILDGPNGQQYIDRAKECFGLIIDKENLNLPSGIRSDQNPPNYIKIPKVCADDKNTDWLRVRFFIFDTQIIEAAACYNSSDSGSCNAVEIGN